MKIVDKTPYRSESGEIDILGRIQGTLKHGLTWYNRIQAQDTVIAIMEKQLGNSYTLLRNITLPNTEINLPMVLVGPPGVFLINVTHEHGIYLAKDDEWGTITEGRESDQNFVPARINQISRTLTFGRVLQVYLDRQGFKGMFVVDPILMAADPGMHIESTRPAVRVVMSDALERFAASLGQGRAILNAPAVNDVIQSILVGRTPKQVPEPGAAAASSAPADAGKSAFDTYIPGQAEEPESGGDPLAFSFSDEEPAGQPAASMAQEPASGTAAPAGSARPRAAARSANRKRAQGLTRSQWTILTGLLIFWLCIMAGFAIYIYFTYFANA